MELVAEPEGCHPGLWVTSGEGLSLQGPGARAAHLRCCEAIFKGTWANGSDMSAVPSRSLSRAPVQSGQLLSILQNPV